jgi:hypothetical protein
MRYLIYVFYFEAASTFLSAAQALFAPALFLGQFTADTASTLAIEMTRWYGVVLFVLIYLLIQGLRLRGAPLKLALQALLFGDFLQIGATVITANALGGWSTVLVLSAVFSVIFLVVRVICLWKPAETGIDR